MSAAIALAGRMIGADLLKLRKRRVTVIWALLIALAPIAIYFIVRAGQHASNPSLYGPAGGLQCYPDALRIVAIITGPLAAIFIGVEAGAGDASAGVFRDLIVTGRDRTALFATRVPAALALGWVLACGSYLLLTLGTLALAGGTPTPSGGLLLEGFGFTMLSTGAICVVAVGFGALTASRPAALTALIGWELVASPLLARIESLGAVRKGFVGEAIGHFSPVDLGGGPHGVTVTMSVGVAIVVIAVWVAVFLALGAWRTRTMDA